MASRYRVCVGSNGSLRMGPRALICALYHVDIVDVFRKFPPATPWAWLTFFPSILTNLLAWTSYKLHRQPMPQSICAYVCLCVLLALHDVWPSLIRFWEVPHFSWQTQLRPSDYSPLWHVSYIDDNGRDFASIAYNVKNLVEKWKDLSVCHREARALTKRLEVTNIGFSRNNVSFQSAF